MGPATAMAAAVIPTASIISTREVRRTGTPRPPAMSSPSSSIRSCRRPSSSANSRSRIAGPGPVRSGQRSAFREPYSQVLALSASSRSALVSR